MSDEQKAAVRDIVSDLTGLDIETQLGRSAPLPVSTHRVWSSCGFTPGKNSNFSTESRNTSFLGVLLELAAIPLPWMRPRELVAATGGIKHSVALT